MVPESHVRKKTFSLDFTNKKKKLLARKITEREKEPKSQNRFRPTFHKAGLPRKGRPRERAAGGLAEKRKGRQNGERDPTKDVT